MIATIAVLLALAGTQQPIINSPMFHCSPTMFRGRSGEIRCREGIEIVLWGVSFPKSRQNPIQASYRASVASSLRARDTRVVTSDYLLVIDAPQMECYSASTKSRRVAQC